MIDPSLFRLTFSVATLVGMDARGDETRAAATTATCYFEPSARTFKDSNGYTTLSSGIIYTQQEVSLTDLVWPPGANNQNLSESFKPLAIGRHYNFDGVLEFYSVTF